MDRKKEHLHVLLRPGAICLINVLRSAIGEDCAVSVRCRIALFLQTDTLFPAISLAGAGTSRRAVAWEMCSTIQWEKRQSQMTVNLSQVYWFVGGVSWVLFCFLCLLYLVVMELLLLYENNELSHLCAAA